MNDLHQTGKAQLAQTINKIFHFAAQEHNSISVYWTNEALRLYEKFHKIIFFLVCLQSFLAVIFRISEVRTTQTRIFPF